MRTTFFLILSPLLLHPAAGQQSSTTMPPLKGVTCSTCHTCEVPTKENPCVKACPRAHMVTVHHSAEDAPNIFVMSENGDSSDLYLPVRFSHRWHAEMSSMAGGCELCHHYNPPGSVLACRDCHSAERQRTNLGRPDLRAAYHRQCIDCHREWEHGVECTSCHAYRTASAGVAEKQGKDEYAQRRHPTVRTPERIVYETPLETGPRVTFYHDEHASMFGLKCVDCHSREGCIRCHDRKKPESPRVMSSGAGHGRCESCHDTGDHCEKCHGQDVKGKFDHLKRTGFSLTDYHGGLACSRCHTTKGSFAGLKRSCISCHRGWNPGNFKHAVTGLTLDATHKELECALCHADEQYGNPAGCENCHEGIAYPARLPGTRRSVRGG
jgi:hypothetical protein